ncbi:MAG: hypothetical protein ACPGVU_24975 [Limisphaerales bacterium]
MSYSTNRGLPAFVRLALLLAVAAPSASAQSITNITWSTRFASPQAQLDAQLLTGIRLIAKIGEDKVIGLSSLGARVLGLQEAESEKLGRMLNHRYEELSTNAVFKTCPSQLATATRRRNPPSVRPTVCNRSALRPRSDGRDKTQIANAGIPPPTRARGAVG